MYQLNKNNHCFRVKPGYSTEPITKTGNNFQDSARLHSDWNTGKLVWDNKTVFPVASGTDKKIKKHSTI